jgi:integrase
MGVTVRQKVKGKGNPWWVFVAHNGKRTSRMVGKKSAAEETAAQIQAQLALGQFAFEDIGPKEEKRPAQFKEYADAWIENTVPAECKRSTLTDYQVILRLHVGPVFNDRPITEITKGDIKDFLRAKIRDGYAKSTINHMKNAISGVMNQAVDKGIISANPVYNLEGGRKKNSLLSGANKTESVDPLTRDELAWLLQVAEAMYPQHYPMLMTLARTGMRVGEVLGLQWGDIDFHGRFITVRRGLSRGLEETPKSDKTRRVDMSGQLAVVLKNLKHERKVQALGCGWGAIPEWVFVDSTGGTIDLSNWRRRVFAKALAKAELRQVRVHDIRHSYASIRIGKGDNIQDVSKQLGHSSVKLTLDVYSHWLPGKKKAEVDALDDENFVSPSAPQVHPGASEQEKRATV